MTKHADQDITVQSLSKQEAEHWKSFAYKLIEQYPDLKDTEEERCAEMMQTYLEKVCTRVGIRFAAPVALCSHPTSPYILSALAIFNDACVEKYPDGETVSVHDLETLAKAIRDELV
jgi:hypothetical protein